MKFSARVIPGKKIAQTFGMPTANLDVSNVLKLEKTGVFAVNVRLKNQEFRGVLFIGKKFFPEETFSAELFIFDFSGNLYNQILEIETKKFIRSSQKFPNSEELFKAIKNDIVRAKKFFLRGDVFQKWEELSDQEIKQITQNAVEKLALNTGFGQASNVLIFAPIENEIRFVEQLIREFPQKKYFFPRIIGNEIRFFESEFSNLEKDKLGIATPLEPAPEFQNQKKSIIIVPGIAADKKGNRLGRGGGFYDRFLSSFNYKKIMVLPEFAVFGSIPTEKHDVRVDFVLSI